MLNSRGVGFVTYTNEANAQFAKEAMAHQSLDHNEILNVRWATQDPNPAAQAREKRRVEEQAAAAIRAALPAEFVAELEGKDRSTVKKRRIEGTFGLRGYEAPDEVWYARGENSVNPAGRITTPCHDTQAVANQAGVGTDKEGGIFSSSTLAVLKGLQGANVGTNIPKTPGISDGVGLDLDYGSDSD